jgi:hypothetical protein
MRPSTPRDHISCPHCAGSGCDECDGLGDREARSLAELAGGLKARYQARVVLPVGMIDHSGVSYYVGGGAHLMDPGGWDSGTAGFILDTPDRLAATMGDAVTDGQITEALTGEVAEYDSWARGDCYGYTITDANGEEVDSRWGFIGHDYAVEAATEAADGLEPPGTVRFTVTATVEVDRAEWATAYGVDTDQVPADVAAYFTVEQIREAVDAVPGLLGPLAQMKALAVAMPEPIRAEEDGAP